MKKAMKSATAYNANLQREKRSERSGYFDLQTMVSGDHFQILAETLVLVKKYIFLAKEFPYIVYSKEQHKSMDID